MGIIAPIVDIGRHTLDKLDTAKDAIGIVHPVTSVTKIADQENKGLFTYLTDFPGVGPALGEVPILGAVARNFPIGLQLGTFMGMEGTEALITDIATDPGTWTGIGAFRQGPRAVARIGGRVAKKGYRAIDDLLEASIKAGRSDEAILQKYLHASDRAARFETDSLERIHRLIADDDTAEALAGKVQKHIDDELAGPRGVASRVAEGGVKNVDMSRSVPLERIELKAEKVKPGSKGAIPVVRPSKKDPTKVVAPRKPVIEKPLPQEPPPLLQRLKEERSATKSGKGKPGTFSGPGAERGLMGLRPGQALRGGARLPNVRDLGRIKKAVVTLGPQKTKLLLEQMINDRKGAAFLASEFGQRIAAGEKVHPDEIKKLLHRISQLHPSQRNRTLFSKEGRKAIATYVKLKRAGMDVPRLPVTWEEQAALRAAGSSMNQRSLLDVKIPFTNKGITVITGQPVFRAMDKITERMPLTFKRGLGRAGLVKGAITAAPKIDRELMKANPAADASTVGSVMEAANIFARGIDHGSKEFKDVAYAALHMRSQAVFMGKMVRREVELAIDGILQQEFKANWAGKFRSKEAIACRREIEHFLVDVLDNPSKWFETTKSDVASFAIQPLGKVRKLARKQLTALDEILDSRVANVDLGRLKPRGALPFKVTPQMENMAQSIRAGLKSIGEELLQRGQIENVVENYFPRVISRIKKPDLWAKIIAKKMGRTNISGFYSHGLNRSIPYLDILRQAEKEGIIVIEKSPAKLLEKYYHATIKASADRQFVDQLVHSSVRVVKDGQEMIAPAFIPIKSTVKGKDKKKLKALAQSGDYVQDHSEMLARMGEHDGSQVVRPFASGGFVHKDVHAQLRRVIEPSIDVVSGPDAQVKDKFMRAITKMNSIRKGVLLSASGFHFMALTETAIATMGSIGAAGALPAFLGRFSRFQSTSDIIHLATRTGLNVGETIGQKESAAFTNFLHDNFRKLQGTKLGRFMNERMAQRLGKPVEKAADLQGLIDHKLWDHYHNGLKLFAWNETFIRALDKNVGVPIEEIAKSVSEFTNNSFGGLVWEKFWGGSKQGQALMRLAMLAPDWTVSNLRVAWDIFANMVYRGANIIPQLKHPNTEKLMEVGSQGAVGMSRDLFKVLFKGNAIIPASVIASADRKAQFARGYALRTTIGLSVGSNMLNYMFNGHFMEDNPSGREHQIMLPKDWWPNPSKPAFMDFGKQFNEPLELMEDPMQFFRRKESTFLGDMVSLAAGVDRYGRPIVAVEDGPLMKMLKQGGHLMGESLPISVKEMTRAALSVDMDNPEGAIISALAIPGIIPLRQGVPPGPRSSGGGDAAPTGAARFRVPNFTTTNQFMKDQRQSALTIPR